MRQPKLEIWHAKDGWRWRLKAANGRIVAESGGAYASRWNARRGFGVARSIFDSAYMAGISWVEVRWP